MSHQYASELHPNPDPNALRVCEGCGCTDGDACLDPETGEPCYWIESFDGDLCSVCFVALATGDEDRLLERAEVRDTRIFRERGEVDPPLVVIATDHEADLAIRERRKAAGQ